MTDRYRPAHKTGLPTNSKISPGMLLHEHYAIAAAEEYLQEGKNVEALRVLDENRVPSKYRKQIAELQAVTMTHATYDAQKDHQRLAPDDYDIPKSLYKKILEDNFRAYCAILGVEDISRRC